MKLTAVAWIAAIINQQSSVGAAVSPGAQQKPPYFILTGDSTVAVKGGWGDGFLSFVKAPAEGINPAKSGATTVSFRRQGLWDKALQAVRDNAANAQPIVTMQFGHNDQKPAANISTEQFRNNLEVMSREAREAGAFPVGSKQNLPNYQGFKLIDSR